MLREVPAGQLLADETHLWWTEARVHEYDDEPVYISRAAVRRLDHRTLGVETVFDFERDGIFCTPHDPVRIAGATGWLCAHERLESNQRSDPSRWALLRSGRLHTLPLPRARPGRTATDGRAVLSVQSGDDRRPELARLQVETGSVERIAVLPDLLSDLAALAGVSDGALLARPSRDRAALWAVPLDGSPAHPRWRAPRGTIGAAISGGARIVASWGDYPDYTLTVAEGGRVREVHRSAFPALALLLDGDRLYFHSERQLRRLDLRTDRLETLTEGAPREGHLAVGGGWLYWAQERTLRRLRLG